MGLYSIHGARVTRGLVEYLLGSGGHDYYKLIHQSNHEVVIIPFNLHGSLNAPVGSIDPHINLRVLKPPTKILSLEFKEKSLTTVIMTLDNNWAISFRIHNASSKVEPSLKFDIQLDSTPDDLYKITREWS